MLKETFKKMRVMTEGASLVKNMNLLSRNLNVFEDTFKASGQLNENSLHTIQTLYDQVVFDLLRNGDIVDEILSLEYQLDVDRSLMLSVFGQGQNKLEIAWMRLRIRLGNVNQLTGKTLIKQPEINDDDFEQPTIGDFDQPTKHSSDKQAPYNPPRVTGEPSQKDKPSPQEWLKKNLGKSLNDYFSKFGK